MTAIHFRIIEVLIMAHPLPKSGIMDIKPYIGGEGKVANAVRLASNENPLGCSPMAKAAYLKVSEELHRYPDGAAAELRAAIGSEYGMDPERIVCGAGSDELISLLVRGYAGVGDEVLYSEYGFLMYPIAAKACGATPVAAKEKEYRTDVDALLKAVTPKTKMVFVANPNNPTGSYIPKSEMQRLREGLPDNVLLVIDAAYAEFVTADDYDCGKALVDTHQNVVSLRTFSKIHGLAALRLGWGYCPPDVAGVINRVRGAFNVGVPAQMAGIAALQDKDFVKRTLASNSEGRAYLTAHLSDLGVKVLPTVCNFMLVEFGPDAEKIRLGLKDRAIFVRQMGAYNLPNHLRITIGLPDDNARVVAALKEILA